MDSALVLAIAIKQRGASNVTAYTAFVDRTGNDDLVAAVKLCAEFCIPHKSVRITGGDELFQKALTSIEIPSKAQIEIAALCLPLARRIRADGFKACLSAESADELFGGYGNFCIQASKADDAKIVQLRQAQLAKMSRGNFVRCNKAFMAGGVECRLPFMHPRLVTAAVNATKAENPPGKKLLKHVAEAYLPRWVIARKKETFQGASGSSALAARLACDPQRWYNAELRKLFGYLPHD
jgi:asparagine synthase (glutamine-hydrolysing)